MFAHDTFQSSPSLGYLSKSQYSSIFLLSLSRTVLTNSLSACIGTFPLMSGNSFELNLVCRMLAQYSADCLLAAAALVFLTGALGGIAAGLVACCLRR